MFVCIAIATLENLTSSWLWSVADDGSGYGGTSTNPSPRRESLPMADDTVALPHTETAHFHPEGWWTNFMLRPDSKEPLC